MKLIRCLLCNKVLGEVEGKAKIKCKMAGCHCMNVIDTEAGTQFEEARLQPSEFNYIIGSSQALDKISESSMHEIDEMRRLRDIAPIKVYWDKPKE